MAVAPVGGWLAAGGRGGSEPWLLGAGDRHLGRRLRRAVRLPGSRLRSRARPALDSRCASACARSLRDLARACTSSRSSCLARARRRSRTSAASISPASPASPRCSSTSSRSCRERRSVAGQARVRPERLRRHPVSRHDRGCDLCPLTAARRRSIALAITGASGALYATRTLAALLERGCHLELIVSDYGRRLLRDELGERAAVDQAAADYLASTLRRRACAQARYTLHSNKDLGATIASGSHGCEGMVDRAVLDEDAGRRSRTACRATWSSAPPT